jgi:chromosome segregation ATPase
MRWVIGILVAVVLVIIGYQYFGSRRGVEVAEQAAQKTEETAKAAGQAVEKAGEQAAETTQKAAEATQEAEQAQKTAEQAATGAQQATEQSAETAQQATQEAQQATKQAAEATQGAAQQATEQAQGAAQQAQQATKQAAEATQEAAQATQGAAEATAEGALTEAQTAALTVGNVNLGEQVNGIATNLETTLKGVTDAQSAQAAVPKLKDINAKLEQLSGTVTQLPGDGKKVLADVLSKRVAGLKTLAAEVAAKPGVGTVVKPELDAVIAKLEDWARQPA